MSRLERKDVLTHRREGRQYVYRATVTRSDVRRSKVRELTEHLFGVIRAGDTLYTLKDSEFFLILPFTPEEGVRVIADTTRASRCRASPWGGAR